MNSVLLYLKRANFPGHFTVAVKCAERCTFHKERHITSSPPLRHTKINNYFLARRERIRGPLFFFSPPKRARLIATMRAYFCELVGDEKNDALSRATPSPSPCPSAPLRRSLRKEHCVCIGRTTTSALARTFCEHVQHPGRTHSLLLLPFPPSLFFSFAHNRSLSLPRRGISLHICDGNFPKSRLAAFGNGRIFQISVGNFAFV